jgi:hypothetical protein
VKPTIPITDARFCYVPSAHTDIRKTFDRIRAELAKVKPANVKPLRKASP